MPTSTDNVKPVAEERVSVINLSTRGRKFQSLGFKNPDGTPGETIEILPGAKAVAIPKSAADFLLGKIGDRPRFPELHDAEDYVPASNLLQEKSRLSDENKKLLAENADLRKQLDALVSKEKKK